VKYPKILIIIPLEIKSGHRTIPKLIDILLCPLYVRVRLFNCSLNPLSLEVSKEAGAEPSDNGEWVKNINDEMNVKFTLSLLTPSTIPNFVLNF
jgi:hypothetical protein